MVSLVSVVDKKFAMGCFGYGVLGKTFWVIKDILGLNKIHQLEVFSQSEVSFEKPRTPRKEMIIF